VADENTHDAGGDAVSGRDLMGDDGTSSALEAFKALHHPERKAAERLLITDCLRLQEEKRKIRHNFNGHFGKIRLASSSGTVFCIWEHNAEGGKAVERDRKAAEAGRGVGQPGEDNQFYTRW
jgi:hypothetical protein